MSEFCIGIDLGGTYIKFALMDADHRVTETVQSPTPAEGADAVVEQMVAGAKQLMAENDLAREEVRGVGIGSPGPLDLDNGIVIGMPNIRGMSNLPLRDRVSAGLGGVPAILENDANAAAYGEHLCGAGAGRGDMVMLTLGTGVGSGIILDGKVLHGTHGIGAEFGHMIVEPAGEKCGCGQRGCLERYCSATYIAELARRLIEQEGRDSSLKELLAANGGINAKDINEARAAGDELAAYVWDNGAYYIALACVNICRIFDPDEIVLAGGMVNAGDDLMKPLTEHFRRLHWTLHPPRTKIAIATLGSDAGVIGAAGVAWQAFGESGA